MSVSRLFFLNSNSLETGGVTLFQPSGENGLRQWTSTARKILDRASDRIEVLKSFVGQFSPMSWTGSHAAILESNAKYLEELAQHEDHAVRQFIAQEKIRLGELVRSGRRTEALFDRQRDERFE
jgi:hypothetical protein